MEKRISKYLVISALIINLILISCSHPCIHLINYQGTKVEFKTIKGVIKGVDFGIGEISLDPQYREATDAIKQLDAQQYIMCEAIKQIKSRKERKIEQIKWINLLKKIIILSYNQQQYSDSVRTVKFEIEKIRKYNDSINAIEAALKLKKYNDSIALQEEENNKTYYITDFGESKILAFRNRALTAKEINICNKCNSYINSNGNIIYDDLKNSVCIQKKQLDAETAIGDIKTAVIVELLDKSEYFSCIKIKNTGKIGWISSLYAGKPTLKKINNK